MRDVLITGGAGKIGFNLVKKLLDTNYSVTILDLESKDSLKKLFKIKNKVKFVYGDIEDANLVRDLVKKNDIVIDYAGIMPPLANLNEDIAHSTNYLGTKNIVDAINETNPDCIYIYMSFISIYGSTDKAKRLINIDTDSTHPDDYYSISVIRSEDYIKTNLKKYSIIRMPIVLTRNNYFLKHMKLGRTMDFITRDDLNDLVMGIMQSKKIFGKVYNVSGFRAHTEKVVEALYKATGEISILKRNIYYGEYEDGKVLNGIVDIEYDTLKEAFDKIGNNVSRVKRTFKKTFNYFKYLIFKNIIKNRR